MAKIYATMGPSCARKDVLKLMFANGMTGMRLDLNKKTIHDYAAAIAAFHEAKEETGVQAELLIDVQGPEGLPSGDPGVLTDFDRKNIRSSLFYGVTGLMQPFVRGGEDIVRVREALKELGAGQLTVFGKIESMRGVEHMNDIIDESDVIIIARGDLGNDMLLWNLPGVQKDVEKACRKKDTPFVIVNQMLATMEHAPIPTRAEVSDIFNAVVDGAYGVMLTRETAVGDFPEEAIRYLANTARSAEKWRGRCQF